MVIRLGEEHQQAEQQTDEVQTSCQINNFVTVVTTLIICLIYTVSIKKWCHCVFDYSSRILWSICVLFVPLETE